MNPYAWFRNLSLRNKLVFVCATVGIVPLVVTFFSSYGELRDSVLRGQNYAANQNFEQTLASLTSRISHIEEISSMIMVDSSINSIFARNPDGMDVNEQLKKFQDISAYTSLLNTSSEFDDILYYIDDRFLITSPWGTMYRKWNPVKNEPWAVNIWEGNGKAVWGKIDDNAVSNPKDYMAVGRVMWDMDDYARPIGLVTVRVDLGDIRKSLTKAVPEQLVYLETSDGELVAASDGALLEPMRLPAAQKPTGKFAAIRLDSGKYVARTARIGSTNLILKSVISQNAVSAAVNQIRMNMLTVYFVVSAILLLFIVPVTRSITHRIFLLMNGMSQVRQGRLNTLDIEPREDEVGHLVSSYNYMINSVQDLMKEQFRLGQEKKGAELKALQSQINPHFLYNTLDMLNWMAKKDERENIQQVVHALSDYYKLSLNKGEDFVTVRDELRLCAIYVAIQQKRFKDKIAFVTDVDEAILGGLVPKITLQPLVENAIVHGITEKPEGKGTIAIRGRLEGDRMVLSVEDDGPGIDRRRDRRAGDRGSGYGLSNIEKRLELYFGQPNLISFDSPPGGGARVVIEAPMIRR